MMRYKRGKVDNNPLDPSPAPKKPKTSASQFFVVALVFNRFQWGFSPEFFTEPPPIARVDAEKITQRANEMEEAFGSEPQAGFEQLTFEVLAMSAALGA
jgi:hypothetical protein